jgi:glycosyltransferase involved in cell wall biosynthesis
MAAPPVSAYIPCFNNAATLAQAIAGVRAQQPPVDDLFVVNDGSTDDSARLAASLGVRLVSFERNSGRGPARARAMREARHEFVLCCDATNVLEAGFTAKALPWFEDPNVAAVFGRITQAAPRNAIERWRGRHLFKENVVTTVQRRTQLITYGTMVRKSHVLAAGNYDATLRQGEDRELGARLLARGLDVIYDPALTLTSVARNTLGQVMERYWRWDAAEEVAMNLRGYLRRVAYSVKVMAVEDLRAGDPASALISLCLPHYQLWKTLSHRK